MEVIINKNENYVIQTNFYHDEERLVMVGYSDDFVKNYGGRSEVFEIAANERLIGCELEQNKD